MTRGRKCLANHNYKTIANRQSLPLPDAFIAQALAPFGIQPSPALAAAIRLYTQLLLRWNQKISLTSITDPKEILQRHFGESMFAAHVVPIARGRLFDVGSGAGFPGLALKLISPDLDVTLIEPNSKKSAFLAEIVRTLTLSSVKILSKRIEELRDLEAAADFITCRAVRPDKQLLAWSRATLKEHGRIVLWLGYEDASSLRAARDWSWQQPVPIPLSSNRVLLGAQTLHG
ncbi:MAG: 16S rRNA (guanine(527)-N(7))-methyltransferase RsmG [Acidobacteria bacterium]|nr:16S rRNA (guanine(527)-N(7))-methyltransferase RsmG [Acidobacteriota bacterium]